MPYSFNVAPERIAIPEIEKMLERGCQVPGCACGGGTDRLFLESRCHPKAGVDVCYTKGTGVLTISCHQCQRLVVEVNVALVAT